MAAILYLVVFGSWIGYTAYIWLLQHVPTSKVSTYAYVNPVVAVFLGWLILHERIDRYILMGSAIIVAVGGAGNERESLEAGRGGRIPSGRSCGRLRLLSVVSPQLSVIPDDVKWIVVTPRSGVESATDEQRPRSGLRRTVALRNTLSDRFWW